jgi:hypothetical protein
MNVSTFRAECLDCGYVFAFPLLPEEAFGEFVVVSETGMALGYLNSFAHPAWDTIHNVVSEHFGTSTRRTLPRFGAVRPRALEHVEVFQWVVGRCIDSAHGHSWHLSYPVCSQCRSRNVSYGNGQLVGALEAPSISFAAFDHLTPEHQSSRVRELIAEYESSEEHRGA